MKKKPTYEELEERVNQLEKKAEMYEQAETALKGAEVWLQFLLASNPAVTYTCVPGGDYAATFVSEGVKTQLGYEPNEFVQNPRFWADHIHPEDRHSVFSQLPQVFEFGHQVHEYRFQHKDGSYRWMRDQLHLVHDKEGKPKSIVGYWIDITDRKEMEEALRIKASAMESSIIGIALGDLEGNVTYVNEAFLNLWGYDDQNEVLGKPAVDFGQRKEEVNDIINALRAEGSWGGELVGKRKDGSLVDVQLSASMVMGESGQPICFMGWFLDITDRKSLEKEIEKREAVLEAQAEELQGVNNTLRVLLTQRDQDKQELAEHMLLNIKELVVPYVDKLKKNLSDSKLVAYLNILESNLNDIISPFARKLSLKYSSLTPAEIQIAHLIKEGKTSREIAELLNVSTRTIESHRLKIRTKIGIKKQKTNLRSHLMSI